MEARREAPGANGSRPVLVAHADWGAGARKRWLARAEWRGDHWQAELPALVGEPGELVGRLLATAGPRGCVLLGFDFPIGLPIRYAERAGIEDFRAWLPVSEAGPWSAFYQPATTPGEISLYRPFYPRSCRVKGQAQQEHLLRGLGLARQDDLWRGCERAHPGRPAASPLFWTLGAKQVGKAAISGWREVLLPALRGGLDVGLWPFDGPLFALFRPGRIVMAETYPAEFYGPLGLNSAGRWSKRRQTDRRARAGALLEASADVGLRLPPALQDILADGFGPSGGGEDPFDATIGLLGLLRVLAGRQGPGDPSSAALCRIEGWILGQDPGPNEPPQAG